MRKEEQEKLSELNLMYSMLKNPHVHGLDKEMNCEEIEKGINAIYKEMEAIINARTRITRRD